MRQIVLKSLHLVNFKGIRELDVQFSDDLTTIAGRNGLGKTTIFDAFCWLLFDKNSDDRKTFNIKTLDENGNVIERIPHEVTAVIGVDGKEMKIFKSLNEKWVKQRGSAVEEFKGHDTVCMWNDVPMKVNEFSKKIEDEVCAEQVFKMLTSPSYFTSQKMETQRALLFKMAGDITDEQIAEEHPEFAQLLADMSGKTMEEYKKEIAAKKRKVKSEVDSLPARIDERKRSIYQPEADEKTLRGVVEKCESEVADIDKQLADVSARNKACEDAVMAKSKAIFDLKCKADKRKRDIETELNKSYYEQTNRNNMLKAEIENIQGIVTNKGQRANAVQSYIAELQNKANMLRAEWSDINNKMIGFDESDFVCPVCKRPFDVADIEAKKAEMIANFNAEKVSRLNENMTLGKANKALIEAKTAELEKLNQEINELNEQRIAKINSMYDDLQKPDTEKAVAEDAEIKAIEAELERMQTAGAQGDVTDNSALLERKRQCQAIIDANKHDLLQYELIERNKERVAELEAMLKMQNQTLADLEKTEFNILNYSKVRTDKMEQSVNSLFTNVKFKMFAKQINGGEVETCEAMVNGVPYADLNNAAKINCGLDIINAIIKTEQICAPIFVDNSESINEVQMGPSQYILLRVTEDDKLIIE